MAVTVQELITEMRRLANTIYLHVDIHSLAERAATTMNNAADVIEWQREKCIEEIESRVSHRLIGQDEIAEYDCQLAAKMKGE